MSLKLADRKLAELADKLSTNSALWKLYHEHREGRPLPSSKVLGEIVDLTRAIVFPGYFGKSNVLVHSLKYPIGAGIQQLYELLADQILAGLCFSDDEPDLCNLRRKAEETAISVVEKLPELQTVLATDVEAAYNGDPAAENYGEIISCYPSIRAMTNYRLAHELFILGVPLIPRILTEMAHSETGIDIHPGATIGHHFSIDHGTGVVIGATCVIGNNVKLYQGVTLGAKSFPLDDDGNPIKGIPRHPILEDNVIVYSNATVLGRITIGKGTVIGGNIWVTESTKPGEMIIQKK
ncbi:MAG: serine acetyltransferase [Bacteroidales bacterium]|nr:serine acetyltransferase [Bacteroidales bacterium]MCM1146988.1 serine acetyltransferase [Bacteroidales bacterium]MCM1205879.1 serine acetyltransferase [Bacillota bacterium]MCM1509880.1 serine acetyltransferase [Clostridium sp.]